MTDEEWSAALARWIDQPVGTGPTPRLALVSNPENDGEERAFLILLGSALLLSLAGWTGLGWLIYRAVR